MGIRYYSNFVDINGCDYRVEILDNSGTAAQEVILSSNEPLTIEWKKINKEDNIISSTATLTLESSEDRQFLHLYHVSVGEVVIKIYRSQILYWTGVMDPELYEEPYSYSQYYDVSLTFSDFAALDRFNYSAKGFISLQNIIEMCCAKIGLTIPIVQRIATIGAMDSYVLSDNFYDEDGQAMTLREVLEEVLKPFDLHIQQKCGNIHIFDWHSLSQLAPAEVQWSSDDAMISVDKVYNRVKVSFSPYDVQEYYNSDNDTTGIGILSDMSSNSAVRLMPHDVNNPQEIIPTGFNFVTYNSASGGIVKHPQVKWYEIIPEFSGSESKGIAIRAMIAAPMSNIYSDKISGGIEANGTLAKWTQTIYTGGSKNDGDNMRLLISADILLHYIGNPFEAATDRDRAEMDKLEQMLVASANFVWLPIKLTLKDSSGKAICHYCNQNIVFSKNYEGNATWQAGEADWNSAYITFYNDDRSPIIGTWQTNKKTIGFYLDSLPIEYTKNNKGEKILLPDDGGYLDFEIGTELRIANPNASNNEYIWDLEMKKLLKWVLVKNISLQVVDKFGKTISAKDIEFSSWLNPSAKDELKIDTIVGTLKSSSAKARGQVYTHNSVPIRKFTRASNTGRLEQLLCGTMYSQYASRHIAISGLADIVPQFTTITDKHEPRNYAVMEEIQDIMGATSDLTIIEVTPDVYTSTEIVDK